MNRLLVGISAAALLAGSSIAGYAAEASGTINSIDTNANTVTLSDGNTYELPASEDLGSLQVGQEVTITYEEGTQGSGGNMMASDIEPSG